MGFGTLIEGLGEIGAGIAIDVFTAGTAGNMLIGMGVGTTIAGVGSMIAGTPPKQGYATTTRNPIAPWPVCYGRCRTGGKIVYMNTWGSNDQMLDMVVVLAAHPCQSIDEVLFDQQRVQIDGTAIPTSASAGYPISAPCSGSGTSFTPVQQTINISSINRTNDVVTVVLPNDIPYLTAGDQIKITNQHNGGILDTYALTGTFQVSQIISRVPSGGTNILTFTYLSGGAACTVNNEGQANTLWPDYGRNVYIEPLLGNQTLGTSFIGMEAGTPWQGTGKLCTPLSPQAAGGTSGPNPWTNYCSLVGMTAVFIRLTYSSDYFKAGLPQISFHLSGKNSIYDSRSTLTGYTENAALCVADWLTNQTYGLKLTYGTDIPTTALNNAANICDTSVSLASGGTEPMYACNGQFDLSQNRGTVLEDMLTSCAGRLVYMDGQYIIQPGYWAGTSPTAFNAQANAIGPMEWKPTASIRELYNGCKGTFISPNNKWQSTDYPYYAQDSLHGYSGPSLYDGDINLAADGGDRRWLELNQPFCISYTQAQRVAKIELMRRRNNATGTFSVNMTGYQFAPLDVISLTAAYLGLSSELVEVSATRLQMNKTDNGATLGVELDVQATSSDVYAWSIDEELSCPGYQQCNVPQGQAAETSPWPLSPGVVAPLSGDAIFTAGATEYGNFGLQPLYGLDSMGNATTAIQVSTYLPYNNLSEVGKPQVSCTTNSTGGTIASGDYIVGITASDGTGKYTDYLNFAMVTMPVGVTTGSITANITWASGNVAGDLFIGPNNYQLHYNQTVTATSTTSTATITTFNQSTHGGPDPMFDHLRLMYQLCVHNGVWAQQVQAVTSNTITLAGVGMTSNLLAGRTLSLLCKYDPTVPIPVLNMPIVSNTATSDGYFVITIGTNTTGHQLPDLTTLLASGDVLVLRFNPTYTATSFTDTMTANLYYPTGDDPALRTTNAANYVAYVMTGVDAGDVQPVVSVTQSSPGSGNYDTYNVNGWTTTPATGDLVIILDASTTFNFATPSLSCSNDTGNVYNASYQAPNLANTTWLVTARTESTTGLYGPDAVAPVREIYLNGSQGTRNISSTSVNMVATDGVILTVGMMLANSTYNLLPAASQPNQEVTIAKTDASAYTVTIVPASGDTIDGLSSVVLSVQYSKVILRSDGVHNWSSVCSALALTGTINVSSISIAASQITGGLIQASQINVSSISIAASQITSVNASQITGGLIQASQIAVSTISVAASQITSGLLQGSQINVSTINVNASQITGGLIQGSQINISTLNLNASQITAGKLQASQISTIAASSISVGVLQASQIGSVAASSISVGVLVTSQLASQIINSVSLLSTNLFGPSLNINGTTISTTNDGSGNLLLNPGFENALTGWSTYGSGSVTTSQSYTGMHSYAIVGASNSGVYQQVPVVAGNSYLFSAYMMRDSGVSVGGWTMLIQGYGPDGVTQTMANASISNPLTTSWAQYSIQTGVIPAGTSYLRVFGYLTGVSGSGNVYFDAASVTCNVTAAQIVSVTASTITGYIIANQISSVSASVLNGSINASCITNINTSSLTITGQLNGSVIASGTLSAAAIQAGTLTVSQIGGWDGAPINCGAGLTIVGGGINMITSETGVTNHIAGSLPGITITDLGGASLPSLPNGSYPIGSCVLGLGTSLIGLYVNSNNTWKSLAGLRVMVLLSHALHTGTSVDFTLNGITLWINPHTYPTAGGLLNVAYPVGGVIDLVYAGSGLSWLDMSQ